jgi:hypothetical protein
MILMRTEKYFYDECRDRILFVTQNPCGCHPYDLIIECGKLYRDSISLSFKNSAEIKTYLGKYIELGSLFPVNTKEEK